MSSRLKKTIITSFIILLLLGALVTWQYENIKIIIYSKIYTTEELENMLSENEKIISDALDKLPVDIGGLPSNAPKQDSSDTEEASTDSETQSADYSGDSAEGTSTKTDTEMSDTGTTPGYNQNLDTGASNEYVTVTPSDDTDPDNKKPYADENMRIEELVTSVFVLRDQYKNELETLKNSAISEYKELISRNDNNSGKSDSNSGSAGESGSGSGSNSTGESSGTSNESGSTSITDLAVKYITIVSNLEKECDAKMSDIISELRSLLKKTGGDMSVIDEIKYAYANEKNLTKSYYINMYFNNFPGGILK